MTARQRYHAAVASMTPEQQWAMKVTIMAERRLRTHFQPGEIDGRYVGKMDMAYDWALRADTDVAVLSE